MDFPKLYRIFLAKKNISKTVQLCSGTTARSSPHTELGRVHLLHRYNYRFTLSGYVAAYFLICIWKRNVFVSALLFETARKGSFQEGTYLPSDFLPNHILKPPLISILQKMRMFFLHHYSKYLTKTSKHPASSVKEDDTSPLPIWGSFRLINPHRYFVKLQILDKELWIHP